MPGATTIVDAARDLAELIEAHADDGERIRRLPLSTVKALGDASPNVRTAAADALCNLGRHDNGIKELPDPKPFDPGALHLAETVGDHRES